MKAPRARKELGQNYLISPRIIQKITSDKKDNCSTLEIGPGPGILTQKLVENSKSLHVIEKDSRFSEILKKILPEKNISMCDATQISLEEFIKRNMTSPIWLVSNLPYNVATPLLIQFLKTPSISHMTLMFQKEVADKIYKNDRKNTGSLMALCQNFFKISPLIKAPPGAFSPSPKVESQVLSFKRIDKPEVPLGEFSQYENFLRKLFQNKRKQCGKILKKISPFVEWHEILENLLLSPTDRAETFNLDQIQILYKKSWG